MLIQTATRNDCIVMNYSFETYDIAERFSERFGEFFYAVQAYIPKIQFFELLSVIMQLESIDTLNKQHIQDFHIPYIDKPQIDTIAEKLMITGKNTAFIVSIYNRQWVWDKERESELVDILYNSALKVIGDIDKDRIGLSIVEWTNKNKHKKRAVINRSLNAYMNALCIYHYIYIYAVDIESLYVIFSRPSFHPCALFI